MRSITEIVAEMFQTARPQLSGAGVLVDGFIIEAWAQELGAALDVYGVKHLTPELLKKQQTNDEQGRWELAQVMEDMTDVQLERFLTAMRRCVQMAVAETNKRG